MLNLFDLGQNKGDVTQMMVNVAESLGITDYHLYGFEASTRWHTHCKKRFSNNPKVTCLHNAISNKKEKVKLYKCSNGVGDSVYSDKNNISSKFEEVDAIVFSEWFKKNINADDTNVLKINIEGAEYLFFNDIIDTDTHKSLNIICGCNDDPQKIKSLTDKLTEYYKKVEDAGINVHYYSNYQMNKNFDIKGTIKELL